MAEQKKTDSPAYEIGYAKPPEHGKFKPGQSGNPKGRKKGSKNLKTDLAEELSEPVEIRENGKRVKVSKQRAMIKTWVNKSMNGDVRATAKVVDLMLKLYGSEPSDTEETPLTLDEADIAKTLEAIFGRKKGNPKAEPEDSA